MAVTKERAERIESRETDYRTLYEESQKRLAMLWKAFEDAEARIAELEVLTEGNGGGVPVVEEVEVEKPLEAQPRYPVGIYKMSKVPGIGKADLERLRTYGINLTDELLHADLAKLAEATGITQEKLQHWRDVSELMAINGIGPSWAARLVEAGITDIKQLAEHSPEELSALLLKSYEKEGLSEQRMLVLQRTLPARSKKLINAAKKAAQVL